MSKSVGLGGLLGEKPVTEEVAARRDPRPAVVIDLQRAIRNGTPEEAIAALLEWDSVKDWSTEGE